MWALFSVFSLATIIAVMYLVVYALNKVIARYAIGKELTGLFVVSSYHILISGPLFNNIFWSEHRLNFPFNIPTILILGGIYFFFSIAVFNGVRLFMKRKKGIAG